MYIITSNHFRNNKHFYEAIHNMCVRIYYRPQQVAKVMFSHLSVFILFTVATEAGGTQAYLHTCTNCIAANELHNKNAYQHCVAPV